MAVSAAAAQVEKQQFKNQTGGHIGVTKLDHMGQPVGAGVLPNGTVWLSKDEVILTARASRLPEDSPFVEKPYLFENQDKGGAIEEHKMIPLVLLEGAEYDPAEERFIPGSPDVNAAAVAANQATAQDMLAQDGPAVNLTTGSPPISHPQHQAVPGAHSLPEPEPEPETTWSEPEDYSETPQPGNLGGEGATLAEGAATEETAAETPAGEETGAAATPAGQAPEGEYAAAEEVGTPAAPTNESTGTAS